MFQAHDEALEASECGKRLASTRPFERLFTLLSLNRSQLSSRLRERVSLYDLDSLKDVFTMQPVIAGVESVIKHVVNMITACSDSYTLLYSGLCSRWTSQSKDTWSFEHVADCFMRANDALNERYFFAVLVQFMKDKSVLEELIREAEVRVLVTEEVLENLATHHYYTRPSRSADDDD